MPKSCRIYFNQVISQQVIAIERYSASTLDRDTVLCFLVFQEINELSRNMKYLVTNCQVSRHLAQSALQKAFN